MLLYMFKVYQQTQAVAYSAYIVTIDTITANSYARERALQRAETNVTRWHDIWIELLSKVGELYHRAKNRPEGRRYATVLELENLLRVDAVAPERPTIRTMSGETGEDELQPAHIPGTKRGPAEAIAQYDELRDVHWCHAPAP